MGGRSWWAMNPCPSISSVSSGRLAERRRLIPAGSVVKPVLPLGCRRLRAALKHQRRVRVSLARTRQNKCCDGRSDDDATPAREPIARAGGFGSRRTSQYEPRSQSDDATLDRLSAACGAASRRAR